MAGGGWGGVFRRGLVPVARTAPPMRLLRGRATRPAGKPGAGGRLLAELCLEPECRRGPRRRRLRRAELRGRYPGSRRCAAALANRFPLRGMSGRAGPAGLAWLLRDLPRRGSPAGCAAEPRHVLPRPCRPGNGPRGPARRTPATWPAPAAATVNRHHRPVRATARGPRPGPRAAPGGWPGSAAAAAEGPPGPSCPSSRATVIPRRRRAPARMCRERGAAVACGTHRGPITSADALDRTAETPLPRPAPDGPPGVRRTAAPPPATTSARTRKPDKQDTKTRRQTG